jgi:hypothetical protein
MKGKRGMLKGWFGVKSSTKLITRNDKTSLKVNNNTSPQNNNNKE